MKLSMRIFVLISFLLLGASSMLARQESGQIYGAVTDSATGAGLAGASVRIQGTSLGIATDLYGKYTLYGIPPGTYTLSVSYIGYRSKEVTAEVQSGSRLERNFPLIVQAVEGQEVLVTAQARGQKAAINEQLTSNTIINVVSAEKIHQLPDASAATALSRLPGVSLMNGDQVVIRGIQAKLNQVLINGVELPSTDMNNRATNLGFISSNLLSGIEVIKALTPDMDANTLGGVVNLRLREAPSGLHFDALSQGNYNSSDHVSDNYKFWASVSQRFFDDNLGVFLQGNMNRSDGGNQSARITPVLSGTNDNTYGNATYITSGAQYEYDATIAKTSGGSLILDYRLPNGKIAFQNTYAGTLTDQDNNQIQFGFDNTSVNYTVDRQLYGKDLWINALQAENTFGSVKVDASLSHSYTQQYTRFGHTLNPWTDFTNQSSYSAPFGVDAQGQPIRYNNDEANITLTRALGILNDLNPADADSATLAGWLSSHYNQFYQHLYNTSLNVSAPVNFTNDVTATFKVGGKYVRTTRINNVDEDFSHGEGDTYANPEANSYFPGKILSASNPLRFTDVMDNNFTRGKYYLNSLYNFTNGGFPYVLNESTYDSWLKLSEKGWAVPEHQGDSWKDDWNGSEQYSAGYVMGTFNIGPQVTVLGGVRFESYNMKYHAQFTQVQHTVFGTSISTINGSLKDNDNLDTLYHFVPSSTHNVDRTDNNVFPGVQLQYKVNDWSDVRLAYTTGISRPDYTAIIPKIAFYTGNFELGNPLLRPSTAQNFDVVASFHDNSIGLFTVDAFYKVIKDQMYNTSIYYVNLNQYAKDVFIPDSAFMWDRFNFLVPITQTVGIPLNNPNLGYVRGVELDWQTSFWYLPQPFNALVLDVNYTKSGSNTAYNILTPTVTTRYDTVNGRVKPVNTYSTRDTSYVGRLVQQANDVVNVALGVDYKGFSGRISFSMTGNVINSVGTRPEEAAFTGNIYRWDFTLKQELPIDGLSIAFNGTNIFHNGINTYRNYRTTPGGPITKNLISVLYSPTVFELNMRYSF